MENSIYTPVGFKTKAVIENIKKQQALPGLSTNDKMQKAKELEMVGQLICSSDFQKYDLEGKVDILGRFTYLKNIVDSFI